MFLIKNKGAHKLSLFKKMSNEISRYHRDIR
jgi:hypothetical protein